MLFEVRVDRAVERYLIVLPDQLQTEPEDTDILQNTQGTRETRPAHIVHLFPKPELQQDEDVYIPIPCDP